MANVRRTRYMAPRRQARLGNPGTTAVPEERIRRRRQATYKPLERSAERAGSIPEPESKNALDMRGKTHAMTKGRGASGSARQAMQR